MGLAIRRALVKVMSLFSHLPKPASYPEAAPSTQACVISRSPHHLPRAHNMSTSPHLPKGTSSTQARIISPARMVSLSQRHVKTAEYPRAHIIYTDLCHLLEPALSPRGCVIPSCNSQRTHPLSKLTSTPQTSFPQAHIISQACVI